MDQKLFLIILIIFLLSNEFFFVIKNILKYGIYLIFILYIIKIISPELSNKIKSYIIDFLDDEKSSHFFSSILSSGATTIKNIVFN